MQVSSINSAADARRLMAMADPTSQAGGQAGATSKQIHAAAQQFEALILRQLLEPAMEPLMSGGLGGEQGGGDGDGQHDDGDPEGARGRGHREQTQ